MRRLLIAGVATAALTTSITPVFASPYDAVLPADFVITGPVEDLINLINELIHPPGKREWVTHDPTMAVGTYSITEGPNGRLVSVGVGDVLLQASALREQTIPGRLTEFTLQLQVLGTGADIARDLDGDGDADVVWTHTAIA